MTPRKSTLTRDHTSHLTVYRIIQDPFRTFSTSFCPRLSPSILHLPILALCVEEVVTPRHLALTVARIEAVRVLAYNLPLPASAKGGKQ